MTTKLWQRLLAIATYRTWKPEEEATLNDIITFLKSHDS